VCCISRESATPSVVVGSLNIVSAREILHAFFDIVRYDRISLSYSTVILVDCFSSAWIVAASLYMNTSGTFSICIHNTHLIKDREVSWRKQLVSTTIHRVVRSIYNVRSVATYVVMTASIAPPPFFSMALAFGCHCVWFNDRNINEPNTS
jgi:hypothetical protein